jgi:hypothetical protein
MRLLLEVEVHVEERLAEHSRLVQHQRDQEPADTAVPVEEGVDHLELHMDEGGFHERGEGPTLVVDEPLQRNHAIGDEPGWSRNAFCSLLLEAPRGPDVSSLESNYD